MRTPLLAAVTLSGLVLLGLTACSSDQADGDDGDLSAPSPSPIQMYPNVTTVNIDDVSGRVYSFTVGVSSKYHTPDRYTDAIRVGAVDGATFGTRDVGSDRASEKTFTLTIDDVEIPDDVDTVVVEGHDSVKGWGGGTASIPVPTGTPSP